uniref:Uncharacterized protein n=1 Tax=Peronospora matthiolae TaxID=2874970 RepID=A0AAV1UBP3_9STRA
MTEDANTNDKAPPRTISGSSGECVMNQHWIPWALFDLSGAQALMRGRPQLFVARRYGDTTRIHVVVMCSITTL